MRCSGRLASARRLQGQALARTGCDQAARRAPAAADRGRSATIWSPGTAFMLAKHFRRDSAIKLICVFVLAVHGLSFGLTREYLETFVFYPALTGVFGFMLGAHRRSPDREAAEREAEKVAPELLLKMLVPLTIISLAGTTFVVLYDMYAGSFAQFGWWPIVMGLLCGNSIGSLVRHSKHE